jgi:hypothetical protein
MTELSTPPASSDEKDQGPDSHSPAKDAVGMGSGSVRSPFWLRISPLFLSASLYASLFLAILAPLPLAWLNLAVGRGSAFVATLTNAALIWWISDWAGLAGFLIFALAPAWVISEAARLKVGKRKSVQSRLMAILFSGVVSVVLGGVLALLVWSWMDHVSPAEEIKRAFEWMGAQLASQAPPSQWDPAEWAEQKEELLRNLPSSVAILALLQAWVVLTVLIRLNPSRLRERLGVPQGYLRGWKTPEPWIWPTLFCGFLWVTTRGWPSDLAWNGVKFCMALYALQGVAILSVVCDVWGIRGLTRGLVFFMVLSVMTPLLLAVGFFDLWFDFRGKLRQS